MKTSNYKKICLCYSLFLLTLLSITPQIKVFASEAKITLKQMFNEIENKFGSEFWELMTNIPEKAFDPMSFDKDIAYNYLEEFFDIFPTPAPKKEEAQQLIIAESRLNAGGVIQSPLDGFYVGGYTVKEFQKNESNVSRWGFMILGVKKGNVTGYSILELSGNPSTIFQDVQGFHMLSVKDRAKVFMLKLPDYINPLPFYTVIARTSHPGVNRIVLHGRRGISLIENGKRDWFKAVLKWHPEAANYYKCLSEGNTAKCPESLQRIISCTQNNSPCAPEVQAHISLISDYYDLPTEVIDIGAAFGCSRR